MGQENVIYLTHGDDIEGGEGAELDAEDWGEEGWWRKMGEAEGCFVSHVGSQEPLINFLQCNQKNSA